MSHDEQMRGILQQCEYPHAICIMRAYNKYTRDHNLLYVWKREMNTVVEIKNTS